MGVLGKYKEGEVDLVAATIATYTALEFVRGMAEDILSQMDKHGGYYQVPIKSYALQCMMLGHGLFKLTLPGKDCFNTKTMTLQTRHSLAYCLVEAFQGVEHGRIPLYKDGIFGSYDTSSDLSRKSGAAKCHDDRALIIPFFNDLMTVALKVPGWPVQDEFCTE